jgi:ketosteroid isomerase-like protein
LDEQTLRDLISRADKEPNVIKRTDDTIFVSGAFARPVVGKQDRAAQSKMGEVNKSRINQTQKTELVLLVISDSKDMVYDFGNFTVDYDSADKQHVNFNGSYLRVWRKVKGEWMAEAFFARPNEDRKTTAAK